MITSISAPALDPALLGDGRAVRGVPPCCHERRRHEEEKLHRQVLLMPMPMPTSISPYRTASHRSASHRSQKPQQRGGAGARGREGGMEGEELQSQKTQTPLLRTELRFDTQSSAGVTG